jgi:hypothetical protein
VLNCVCSRTNSFRTRTGLGNNDNFCQHNFHYKHNIFVTKCYILLVRKGHHQARINTKKGFLYIYSPPWWSLTVETCSILSGKYCFYSKRLKLCLLFSLWYTTGSLLYKSNGVVVLTKNTVGRSPTFVRTFFFWHTAPRQLVISALCPTFRNDVLEGHCVVLEHRKPIGNHYER